MKEKVEGGVVCRPSHHRQTLPAAVCLCREGERGRLIQQRLTISNVMTSIRDAARDFARASNAAQARDPIRIILRS